MIYVYTQSTGYHVEYLMQKVNNDTAMSHIIVVSNYTYTIIIYFQIRNGDLSIQCETMDSYKCLV